jgi:hypothetical protein
MFYVLHVLRISMHNEEFKPDSVVQAIVDKFITRAKFGKQKYNTDLDRQDLSVLDWIQHAQDEMHDGILYLEKLKQELMKQQAEK